jgi:hypothetical protein
VITFIIGLILGGMIGTLVMAVICAGTLNSASTDGE